MAYETCLTACARSLIYIMLCAFTTIYGNKFISNLNIDTVNTATKFFVSRYAAADKSHANFNG